MTAQVFEGLPELKYYRTLWYDVRCAGVLRQTWRNIVRTASAADRPGQFSSFQTDLLVAQVQKSKPRTKV